MNNVEISKNIYRILRISFLISSIFNSLSYAQDARNEIIKAGMWGKFSIDCKVPAVPSQPNSHKFEFMFVEDRFIQRIYFDENNQNNYRDRIIRNIRLLSSKDSISNPPVNAPIFEYKFTEVTNQGERDFVTWRRIDKNEQKVLELRRIKTTEELLKSQPSESREYRSIALVEDGKIVNSQGVKQNDVPLIKRCDSLQSSDYGVTSKIDISSNAAKRRNEKEIKNNSGALKDSVREILSNDAVRRASKQYLVLFDVDCDTQSQQHKTLCLKPEVRERADRMNQLFIKITAHPKFKTDVLKEEPQWERWVSENARKPLRDCDIYECLYEKYDDQIYRLSDNLALLNNQPAPPKKLPTPGNVPNNMRGEYGNNCSLRFTADNMEILEPSSGGERNSPNRKIASLIKILKVDKEPGGITIVRAEGGMNYYFYTQTGEGSGAKYPIDTVQFLRLDYIGKGDKRESSSTTKNNSILGGGRCEPYRSITLIER